MSEYLPGAIWVPALVTVAAATLAVVSLWYLALTIPTEDKQRE